MTADPLIEVRDLKTYLFTRRGVVRAVDGVSFSIREGETLGLVGESGSGKTMTALSIERVLPQPAGRIVGGQVLMGGVDLVGLSEAEMESIRGRRIAMILQDPMSSLNPVMTIGTQVAEPLRTHQRLNSRGLHDRIKEMLALVRIPAPETRVREYPHQMSGGMRQRVVGAIALSCQPRLLIADEPTTSLDVTIQAQYLRLLEDIQAAQGVSILIITHDFGIIARTCDRVAVMYAGRIVETADVRTLFDRPLHPYTQALLESRPRLDVRRRRLAAIEGQPPDLRSPPAGCRFAARCPKATTVCHDRYPPEVTVDNGHAVSCWLVVGGEHARA